MDSQENKEWIKIAKVLQDLEDDKGRAFRPVSFPALFLYVMSFAAVFLTLVKIVSLIAGLFGG